MVARGRIDTPSEAVPTWGFSTQMQVRPPQYLAQQSPYTASQPATQPESLNQGIQLKFKKIGKPKPCIPFTQKKRPLE